MQVVLQQHNSCLACCCLLLPVCAVLGQVYTHCTCAQLTESYADAVHGPLPVVVRCKGAGRSNYLDICAALINV